MDVSHINWATRLMQGVLQSNISRQTDFIKDTYLEWLPDHIVQRLFEDYFQCEGECKKLYLICTLHPMPSCLRCDLKKKAKEGKGFGWELMIPFLTLMHIEKMDEQFDLRPYIEG